jgi:hypothetical protein
MKLVLVGVACVAAFVFAGSALGGQPNQSCQTVGSGPPGLVSTTNGFATMAVNVYAGSFGTESAEANPKAVSQYDVACFQFPSG